MSVGRRIDRRVLLLEDPVVDRLGRAVGSHQLLQRERQPAAALGRVPDHDRQETGRLGLAEQSLEVGDGLGRLGHPDLLRELLVVEDTGQAVVQPHRVQRTGTAGAVRVDAILDELGGRPLVPPERRRVVVEVLEQVILHERDQRRQPDQVRRVVARQQARRRGHQVRELVLADVERHVRELLVNSSARAGTVGKPVSNSALSLTGAVPHVGPPAAALADGAAGAGCAAPDCAAPVDADAWFRDARCGRRQAAMPPTSAMTPCQAMRTRRPDGRDQCSEETSRRNGGRHAVRSVAAHEASPLLCAMTGSTPCDDLIHGPPWALPWSRGPRARGSGGRPAHGRIAGRSRQEGSPRPGGPTRRVAGGSW